MKRWSEVDPRARLLIDSIGVTEWQCGACKQPVRSGYACRCSVPGVVGTEFGSATQVPARPFVRAPELEPGSDRVASSPLVRCYPIPVATIQPRNEVPRWARRFFAALKRRLEVPSGPLGVPVILGWGVVTLVVAAALFAGYVWNGPGPRIVAEEPKQLGGPRP